MGFPVLLTVGTVLGFLSGLGIGGGSLLILWLTLVMDMEPAAARTVNLLFFLPAAIISCLLRRRQGALPLKKALPGMLLGCIGALVSSRLTRNLNADALNTVFGCLLLITAARELLWKPKEKQR